MTNNMKWETLSSEYIERYKYFVARKDVCRTQEGKIVDPYFVVELPPTATALALTEDGKVILVKQYRHPIGEVIYETPGGFIDEGEEVITGMKRELMEETGYDFPHVEHLGKIAANPALLNNFTDLFLATGGRKVAAQQLDYNEEIEIVLVSMEELIDMLKRQEIKQSLHTNCIFYGLMKMGLFKL
ncbi:MAG TPA: NUDIX hydrolase [Chitinophagaceae bacterium]|nr:NUDIX hydrolase [Chitinophagaceae bacterium]